MLIEEYWFSDILDPTFWIFLETQNVGESQIQRLFQLECQVLNVYSFLMSPEKDSIYFFYSRTIWHPVSVERFFFSI